VQSTTPILLVEDSEEDIAIFTNALKRSGLGNPFKVVHDGAEAISYLTAQGVFADRRRFPMPGILLLDLTLPKLDGWDVLHWLRSRTEFDKLLVVVLTASLRLDDLRRAYHIGANSFLTKPCRADDLVNLAEGFRDHWFREPAVTPLARGRSPVGSDWS